IALFAARPLTAFAPQYTEAMSALRDVMRCFYTLDVQKQPQCLAFSLQPSGKRSGFVFPAHMLVEQRTETRLPRPPLPNRRPLRAPMTQPLQLSVHALSKASNPSLEVFSQPLGRADEMSEAALPKALPGLRDQRAITDQEPRPVTNELHKRGLRAMGME